MSPRWNKLLLIPLILGALLVWLLWPQSSAVAGWFDDDWLYRVAISIGNTGSADANKKVLVEIDTATLIAAGKMQSDCGDSRFTDAGGKVLKYYINVSGAAGVKCDDASSDYYVLMESIPVGGSIIYHYYGSSSAPNGTQSSQFSQSTFSPNSGPTAASEEKSPGPVVAWSMDEGNGTTINDSTLHTNNSTLGTGTSAPTWTTEDLCANGKCLKFDGMNDYVSKSYSSDTELAPGTGSFSVSSWFRHPSTVSGTDTIISRVDGADANGVGYKVYMDSSGYVCFGIDQTAGSFPVDSACSGATQGSYADSRWHHVTGVKNGTTSLTIYIDGQEIAADTSITATTISGSSPTLYVGIDNGFSNPWDGFIDEVRIYPYAKTAAQVKMQAIRHASTGKGSGGVLGAASNDFLDKGLVGYWKMDESAQNTCTGGANDSCDSSGNGRDGLWIGTTTPTVGKFSNGVTLDGSVDYIDVGDIDL